jgi:hypothetical protein
LEISHRPWCAPGPAAGDGAKAFQTVRPYSKSFIF